MTEISLTLGELVDSAQSLAELNNTKFNIGLAWKISSVAKKVQPHIDDYWTHHRELVTKYGEPDGENTKVKVENMKEFVDELVELRSQVVEFHSNKIQLAELEKSGKEFSGGMLNSLGWLIDDEPDVITQTVQ